MHFYPFDPLLQNDNSPGGRRRHHGAGSLGGDGLVIGSMAGWNATESGPASAEVRNGHRGNSTASSSASAAAGAHPQTFEQLQSGDLPVLYESSTRIIHPPQQQQQQQLNYRMDSQQYEPHQYHQSYTFPPHPQTSQQQMIMGSSFLGSNSVDLSTTTTHLQSPSTRMSSNGFAYGQNTAFQNANFSTQSNNIPQQQFAPFFQQQQQQFHHQQSFMSGAGMNHLVHGRAFSAGVSQQQQQLAPTSHNNNRHSMIPMQQPHFQHQQRSVQQSHPAFYAQPQNGFLQYGGRTVQTRPCNERPLIRLSVSLIDVYRSINKAYYEDRAARRAEREAAHQQAAQQRQQHPTTQEQQQQAPPWDDDQSDYIIREGEIFYDRYIIQERIGKGSFGQVIRAHDTVNKRDVAIKIIKSKTPFRMQAQTEIELLMSLCEMDVDDQHNIVRLESHFMYRNHQCLVFELLSLNLYDLLKNTQFSGVSLNLIRKFAKQILKALHFLSRPEMNIIHCDLKPENILLRHPKRSGIKVVDFGSSCRSNRQTYSYIQSRFYRSPEVILGLPYSVAIDMWSLGCILVEMHTGEPLFSGSDQYDQMSKIVEVLGMVPSHMIDRSTPKYRDLFFVRTVDQSGHSRWAMRPHPPDHPRSGIKPSVNSLASLSAKVRGGTNRRRAYDPLSQADMCRTYELFEDLVLRMLAFDPQQRIKPIDALKHPFLQTEPGQNGRRSLGSRSDSIPIEVQI